MYACIIRIRLIEGYRYMYGGIVVKGVDQSLSRDGLMKALIIICIQPFQSHIPFAKLITKQEW